MKIKVASFNVLSARHPARIRDILIALASYHIVALQGTCLSARSANFGFSPFQLHVGQNPMLPSATRDGPPALEGVTKSGMFAKHLVAMHGAREEFTKVESSASLKKH